MSTRDTAPAPTVAEKRAAACFNEIATLAGRINREFYFSADTFEDNEFGQERASLFMQRVRDAVATMGWLADLGSTQVHGDVAFGDAVQWLMSPVAAEMMCDEGRSS